MQLEDTLETEPEKAGEAAWRCLRKVSPKGKRQNERQQQRCQGRQKATVILDYQIYSVCCGIAERLPAVNSALLCKLLYRHAVDRQSLP